MKQRVILIFAFCTLAAVPALGQKAPAWLAAAAARAVPAYDKDVPAVVLHRETRNKIEANGKLITTEQFAVRILNGDGKDNAIARAHYLVSAEKVRNIEAWAIRPGGSIKEYDKKSVIDLISDRNDVYNEYRIKIIDGSSDMDAGAVFGYTVETESTPLFYQDVHLFQTGLPVLTSRYVLELPQGWSATSKMFNSAQIDPRVSGTSYTWELADLKPVKSEPLSPSIVNLVPRLAVNYGPEGASTAAHKTFNDWLDVSRWASTLYEPQVIITPELAAKARDLTAGAKTELEKIRAIGFYVQNLQYISIDIGVAHGNGYKPRRSDLVFNRGYGDCKDKANLMRAMLKVLDIEAYPIAIYSGDPTYVRTEWASPQQFNHCIIAVRVSKDTEAPTVMEHATLGRLLIFDATDPYTPVGDLPDYLQGSHGLIIAGESGGIAKMPMTPPEADVLDRELEVTLSPTGDLAGTIRERANGQTSTAFRSEARRLSAADYRRMLEGWLTRGSTGARLVEFSSADRHADAAYDLDVEFAAPRYGQLMQNRLLIFKPVVVGRRQSLSLTEQTRSNPIELESLWMRESAKITLPEGFDIDEMPDPIDFESEFGAYRSSYEVKENKLHFTRSFRIKRSLVGPEKYNDVRGFFKKILDAEQSSVVLIRK